MNKLNSMHKEANKQDIVYVFSHTCHLAIKDTFICTLVRSDSIASSQEPYRDRLRTKVDNVCTDESPLPLHKALISLVI